MVIKPSIKFLMGLVILGSHLLAVNQFAEGERKVRYISKIENKTRYIIHISVVGGGGGSIVLDGINVKLDSGEYIALPPYMEPVKADIKIPWYQEDADGHSSNYIKVESFIIQGSQSTGYELTPVRIGSAQIDDAGGSVRIANNTISDTLLQGKRELKLVIDHEEQASVYVHLEPII